MLLLILLIAQTGAQTPQMSRDEDGFVYSPQEAHACAFQLGIIGQGKSVGLTSDQLRFQRRMFQTCVEQHRGAGAMEAKQRAQPAAETEAIRQYRARDEAQQARPMLQIDGLDYVEVEARTCWPPRC